ncbi:MAG: rhombotarget lipoprotein [Pseudomonadota bacterium]
MKAHWLSLVLSIPLLSGCGLWLTGEPLERRSGSASSLVDYLYPDGEVPPERDDTLPQLTLPARVGIAFVPGDRRMPLSASEQQQLLENVADAFRDRSFVSSIEAIPSQYLTSARGVVGMQQVASLFDVDVMALVSHDQLVITSERDSALLYWTIVGMMVVKGHDNEVRTLIDTAVFDAKSGQMLMRAPGMHSGSRNSSFVDQNREKRAEQTLGFNEAAQEMTINLNSEVARFREAVKSGQRAEVAWTNGGGGGLGLFGVVVLGLLVGFRRLGVDGWSRWPVWRARVIAAGTPLLQRGLALAANGGLGGPSRPDVCGAIDAPR